MDKIKRAFEGKKANIAYVVAGYPDLEKSRELLLNLDRSSIDLIEIGIPYSDPIADGKIIFDASFKACHDGINTDVVFDLLEEVKIEIPVVLLVYYNLIYAYGVDNFVKRAKECGVGGFIVADLPYEENEEFYKICSSYKLALIPLISVTSVDRIKMILTRASGFIYALGAIGVSGTKQTPHERVAWLVDTIKKNSTLPVGVGFGIRDNSDVKRIKTVADGAIVGTSIVKLTSKYSGDELIEKINELFRA